jgi:hypothetical protein
MLGKPTSKNFLVWRTVIEARIFPIYQIVVPNYGELVFGTIFALIGPRYCIAAYE